MTGTELRQFRLSLPRRGVANGSGRWLDHCSQADLASELGVSVRTLKRWEAGDVAIPAPVQRLLKMMQGRGV